MKLAMIQMRVLPGQRDENLANARRLVRQAAVDGADVVVLPEVMDFGWGNLAARESAGTIPGEGTFATLCQVAKEHSVYLCAGMAEREGDHLYNAAVLLDRQGKLLLHHRKINELEIAWELYQRGDSVASNATCETEFGRMAIMICADGFAPDLWISRELGQQGAQLVLSPSAWAVPPDHDNQTDPYGQLWMDSYQPVCRQFNCHIAGVSNVGFVQGGAWTGHKCIGCSLLIGPAGEVIAQGSYGESAEEVLLAELLLR